MKAIGYIRVSTEEQAESGLSLEHQKARIQAYATATDLEIISIIEDTASAKNMNRTGLQTALSLLKSKQANAIIILKLDRLTRSVKDLGELVQLFDKNEIALISVQDSINTTTAAGRFVLNILGSIAQWEREAIAERTSAALQIKKSRGERYNKTIPFGYELSKDGIHLIENTSEKKAVKFIINLKNKTMSYRQICAKLETKNIPTKNGGKWQAMTVRNIYLNATKPKNKKNNPPKPQPKKIKPETHK